ncbi:MAG: aldo/keto reductase [Verrucomicrobiota bacterium]|nr:aldo/keto reductase [Verrucomicrobiota bacterium]
MNYREIGNTGVKVSEISLGCWTMGGLNWVNGNPNGWANVNEDEVVAAIKVAIDAGVNHFDNADVYGNGKAERMLARAFKKLGVKSEDYIVATKIGHFPGTAEHAYEPAHIRHQCEQSLINLQRDYVDIYYFHHGWFGEHLEEAAATMDDLVNEGKVRLKGQSAYSADDFARSIPVVHPQVLQSWAHAFDTQFINPGSPVAQLMEAHNLSYVAFSPLSQGLLLDKFDPENPPKFDEGDHRRTNQGFGTERLRALKPKMAKMKERFGSTTEDLAAVAQRYILNFPRVCCVIPGFRNEKQVACNLAATGRTLTAADMDFVRETLK